MDGDKDGAGALPDIYFDGFSITASHYGVVMTLKLVEPNDSPGMHQTAMRPIANIRFGRETAAELARVLGDQIAAIRSIESGPPGTPGGSTTSSDGRAN
jgi:hypothetical protein